MKARPVVVKRFAEREEWLLWRLPLFTGSKIGKIATKNKAGEYVVTAANAKVGIYETIAAKLIGSAKLAEDEESEETAMTRGTRLEPMGIERFIRETGKKAVWCKDDVGWQRPDEPRIAISPDAYIGKTEAVEVKCLSAARHLQAIDLNEIPSDSKNGSSYWYQCLQYFVVNDQLKTLYFVLFDDRFPTGLDYHCITIHRKDHKKEIAGLLQHEKDWLQVVREKTVQLSDRIVTTEITKNLSLKNLKETMSAKGTTALVPEDVVDYARENSGSILGTKGKLERIAKGVRERSIETGGV